MKTTTVYFSATNTTRTVVSTITRTWQASTRNLNLTSAPIQEDMLISSDEVLLVGMPVYGGRIPNVAVESLKHLKGKHTPVVLVAVYGNREFEDALVEMQDLMEANGFFVMAAGAFVAQHSIFPHTAKGRPDAADLDKIKDFAKRCQELINQGFSLDAQSVKLPGNRPYKTPGNIPLQVKTSSKCSECGTCIKVCPTQAIPVDNPHRTDASLCIHCGRCIYVCPEQARHYGGLLYTVAGGIFGWKNRVRKEPEFFF